jgi:hypothetical protein
MTISILRLLRPARNQRNEDPDLEKARAEVLARSCAEVGRVREVLEFRSTAPTYVYRGHCEDCEGPTVLLDGTSCDVCGSRSVVLFSRAWVAPKKGQVAA